MTHSQRILKLLNEKPIGYSVAELMELTGLKDHAIRSYVTRLMANRQVDINRNVRPFVFYSTSALDDEVKSLTLDRMIEKARNVGGHWGMLIAQVAA